MRHYDPWYAEQQRNRFFQLSSENASVFNGEFQKLIDQQVEISKDLANFALWTAPIGVGFQSAKASYTILRMSIPRLPTTWNAFQISLGGRGLSKGAMSYSWFLYKNLGLQQVAMVPVEYLIGAYYGGTAIAGTFDGLNGAQEQNSTNPFTAGYNLGISVGSAISAVFE